MKKLKIGDFLIAGAILTFALLFALSFMKEPTGSTIAIVMKDGAVIKRITLSELNEPMEFIVEGDYHNHILVEKGKIRFTETDCPDKTCVRTGWITRPGQVSACLPNGVLIKIEGSTNDIDAYLH